MATLASFRNVRPLRRPKPGLIVGYDMARELDLKRKQLVERIRASTQIEDARILNAFATVPRHVFLSETQRDIAYEDRAVPLGEGQTVSQPSMIAIMLAELSCEPWHRALEIGTGSGYAAALLGQLVREVYGVELLPALAELASTNLSRSETLNVHVSLGDGSVGLAEHAPYDRILVSAAPSEVPSALIEQLAPGGRIAIPVGDAHNQTLLLGEKDGSGELSWRRCVPCIFVPLVSG
ncbi:MAG TPA: protein-L-isoaspartate(D-aspartate) O-methyltransferase [Polyangiaceae bacterium]|nr:protein-L-isoaspartate(D-aspartate) O-methyltransferase [Polyangiaceae bacterium]